MVPSQLNSRLGFINPGSTLHTPKPFKHISHFSYLITAGTAPKCSMGRRTCHTNHANRRTPQKYVAKWGNYGKVIHPIGSMYGIYGNIYHQYTPNVSIYTIHGSYGHWNSVEKKGSKMIRTPFGCISATAKHNYHNDQNAPLRSAYSSHQADRP